MDEELLLQYNKAGVIPGSFESEKDFLNRVDHLKKKITETDFPPSHWDWVRAYLKELFDIEPCYFSAFYSNRSLAPWQGAAAWFEEGKIATIQLKEALRKGTFLKIYRREEILAHEAIHMARGELQGERFEEFFAYMTSEKKWRRVLGPIVQRPWEVWPLFIFSLLSAFSPLFLFLSALWVGGGFFRLVKNHRTLNRAASKIFAHLLDVQKTRAVLVRLNDEEIVKFSKGENILLYAKKQTCLRWRAIRLAYL